MKRYVIAIDLGGTNIKIALIKDEKEIAKKIILPTKTYKNKNAMIEELCRVVLKMIDGFHLKESDISGIGVGAPGLIDSERGIIHHLVNIKGFKEVPLKRLIEAKTGIKTFLDNDVNVMTLGELYYGAGRGAKNMVCITLGTGVGGGIVIDGRLYRGSSLAAGEIGHMPLNEAGPKCNCGGLGCVEKFVGNTYIIGLAVKKIKEGGKTLIKNLAEGDLKRLTPKLVSAAAQKGDRLAIGIWEEVGGHLGVTLAGVVNLLNPDRIVIGGGVAEAGKVLFDAIRKTVKARAMKLSAGRAKIVKAQLGQDAGLIGAAVLVRLGNGGQFYRRVPSLVRLEEHGNNR